MQETLLDCFMGRLFLFLTGRANNKGLLVKKHVENLQTYGDISFPGSLKSWREFVDSEYYSEKTDSTFLQVINKTHEDIVDEAKKWTFQVKRVKEERGRVYLFLDRRSAIPKGLTEGSTILLYMTQRLQEKFCDVRLDPLCEQSECLTTLRLKYLCKVVENLCSLKLDRKKKPPEIFLTSKSSSTFAGYKILCSTVLSTKTGSKEVEIDADEFIRLRQNEMTLVAQHKYGVRVSTDFKWQEFMKHLGESAVAFELLQNKPTSVVKINFDISAGASKGASFILYNCARLETIIRTYIDKVNEGTYPPLPDFEEVDFALLTQEEEWNLVYNYIIGLPNLIESCVEIKDNSCEFRPHYICSYLSSMVRIFSQYYRKTRILVEPRTHLLPTIYARMHMLSILNNILKLCLRILNIKSVSQM